ncbi:MAG: hypothetical protein JRI23_17990 [Deltaproteobacteria bacterium]|jgi:VanZ family protein|nr:hypothetical protein [Deltaproteobacteria bacterium]MBW2533734.1 hypothetical protein [Deltaproteobacteria bacterium]
MRTVGTRSLWRFRLACGAYFAFILAVVVLADRGALPIRTVVPYDVVLHFFLIGLAGWLLHGALGRKHWGIWPVGPILVAVGATLEEISQAFVVARTFSLADMAANVAGVAVVYALDALWVRRRAAPAA